MDRILRPWTVLLALLQKRGIGFMIPARLVLAVQDSRYVEPLLSYVHGSSYGSALQVTAFTRIDSFLHYMEVGKCPIWSWGYGNAGELA